METAGGRNGGRKGVSLLACHSNNVDVLTSDGLANTSLTIRNCGLMAKLWEYLLLIHNTFLLISSFLCFFGPWTHVTKKRKRVRGLCHNRNLDSST